MDSRAQVSFEYLLAALFGIVLAITAAVLIDAIRAISISAQTRVLEIRERTISTLV